ncbi:trypsin-like serine peptidase [Nonomuraea sp. NPDC050663]|uniref:trypsin-like serine peptidase n=1 Tax=Nonomuraea sp. NPDC050663 TaxID=3364370 RepID=UPI0037894E4E
MKRILIPASGAVLATGLLAAGLATSAQAAPDVAADALAKNAAAAQEIAKFWSENNNAALKAATASNVWDNSDVTKLKSSGGYSADSKPGLIGTPVTKSSKVHNVNLPKTIGKVFFVNNKGEKKWCSATAIQSKYKNLVSTAGHCVYDVADNTDVMSKWVFVPGYYQGKAPYGIYVGKQAFTHYDFDVYEDFDRDYAFVTVYNGINISSSTPKEVTKSVFTAHTGPKFVKAKEVTEAEYLAGVEKYGVNGPFQAKPVDPTVETVAKPADVTSKNLEEYISKGINGVQLVGVETSASEYEKAPKGLENGYKFERLSVPVPISQNEYDKLVADKADGKLPYIQLRQLKDDKGNVIGWEKQQFFVKRWTKTTVKMKYWQESYFTVDVAVKDAGRLGDNVGGQGFAWNQPTGKYIRVFGYPALAHPDGNKNFTGVTPKWCYGKTSAKVVQAPAKKIEEHVSIRCSMTEGADGGPWLYNYSNAKRIGYVNGVTSTFADQDGNNRIDTITSPYFDGETATVYRSAANVWSGKIVG